MPRKRINAETKIKDPWAALSGAISSTLQAKESDLRLTMIMQACNDLVLKGELDKIYNGLLDLVRQHFNNWHEQLKVAAGDPLLTLLSDQFEDFKKYCIIFPTFYTSYDQHFRKEHDKTLKSIRKLFVDVILSDKKLFGNAATPSILDVISSAQKGSDVNLDKIKNIIQMYYLFYNDQGKKEIFEDFFEKLVIQEGDFYDSFFNNNFLTSSFTSYLMNTQEQFKKDKYIMEFILEPKQSKEILTLFNMKLLEERGKDFLEGPEPPISEALTYENLLPMKYLVETYNDFGFSQTPLYESCANFVMNEMLKLTQDFPELKDEEDGGKKEEKKQKVKEENTFSLIGKLINKAIQLSEPYNKVFKDDKDALSTLDDRIKTAWNNKRFNIVVNFNDYIDTLITTKFKGYDISEQLVIIPRFYKYLNDRASFNTFYEASFVRRLIRMRSSIEEYDYPLINAIQKIATGFMQKLDSFKKALSDSEQLKEDYKNSIDENDDKKTIQLEPFVIDYLVFPLDRQRVEAIPSMAMQSNDDFKRFYLNKHAKKELTLVYHGSLIEFQIKIPARKKAFTITMDLLCGCVVCALSQKPYKFSEIISLLNNDEQAARKVVSKLYSKFKLIVPTDKIVKLSKDDVFQLNPLYTSDKTKVLIPPIFQKNWRDRIPDVIEYEKKEAVKFAIIRSLKQKQKMESGELERDIIAKLHDKFEVNVDMIKRQLAGLEGQYVRKDIIDGQTIITYIG